MQENIHDTNSPEAAMIFAALEMAYRPSKLGEFISYEEILKRFPEAYKTISDSVRAAHQEADRSKDLLTDSSAAGKLAVKVQTA